MNLNNAYAISNEKTYGVMVRFRSEGSNEGLTGSSQATAGLCATASTGGRRLHQR